tara:strand:+ start:3984 stop:4148 length:165 start_codon:yes stop_codon:yes gene_type:complete
MTEGIGIQEQDLRLLIEILNNLQIQGKDTAIQLVRIIMALESALPEGEDSSEEE